MVGKRSILSHTFHQCHLLSTPPVHPQFLLWRWCWVGRAMIRNSEKLGGLVGRYFFKATYSLACVRISAVMWIPPLASQDHPNQGPVSARGRVREEHIFLMLHHTLGWHWQHCPDLLRKSPPSCMQRWGNMDFTKCGSQEKTKEFKLWKHHW